MASPKDKWDLGVDTVLRPLGLASQKMPAVPEVEEMPDPDDREAARRNMREIQRKRAKGGRVASIMSGGGLG